jgi:DNA-binding NarL/FixJ family response regulator
VLPSISYARAPAPVMQCASTGGGGRSDRRVRLLVVDDIAPTRRVICELLRRRGFDVVAEADSAAMAVRLTDRFVPDGVLLDVELGGDSGFDVASRLTRRHPGLLVLLTSAVFDARYYAVAERCGAAGFVPKSNLAQVDLTRFWPNPGYLPINPVE